jgi:rhamnosyltransferase
MGGTNPSLVEALSCSNTILALDVPFTREVAEDSATYFRKDADDLKTKIEALERKPVARANEKGYEIYKKKYSIEPTIDAFVGFLDSINGKMKKKKK